MRDLAAGILREWAPPATLNLLRSRFGNVRFHGDYPSWEAAARESRGYSSDNILERVRQATLAVKEGRAAFERDSVLFDRIEYSWPVLSALLWSAGRSQGRLHVLDYGGSLGSSYRQNLPFLSGLPDLKWSVVEQPNFVECGKREFEDGVLRFFPDIGSCLARGAPDAVLFSSVLNYLPDPFETLEGVLGLRIPLIIVDRTPFLSGDRDRICVQTVSKRIYPASYPARFFSKSKFLGFFSSRYELAAEFESLDKANIPSEYLGFIFRLREGGLQ